MLSCVGQTDLGGHGGRAEEIRLVDEGPTIAEINAVALRVAAEAQAQSEPACELEFEPDFERRRSFGDAGWADHAGPDVQGHLRVYADILI